MFKRRAGKRFYKKAPAKFLLTNAKRLKKLAGFSFVLSLFFIILSNPFSVYETAKNFPTTLLETKKIISSLPDFIKIFPSEAEKNSFAFFDWTKAQLDDSGPIFAKETTLVANEAGQSAVTEKIDYATLPFFIEIPKLNIYETVHSNVDPNNAKEYKAALEDGVAHALNSAFPGQDKMIYIFGHSTDGAWNVEAYNAVFYQIKDLEIGDQIILHLGDEKFVYVVSAQDIIKSSEIDFVNNVQAENILLLQTCWPPGTSWQRLFVSAVPVSI
ncbi:sortase [Patescibacteria group bacterium]|nr:sortase [Patescibacteria group bacterium]